MTDIKKKYVETLDDNQVFITSLSKTLDQAIEDKDIGGGVGGVDILLVQDFNTEDLDLFTHTGLTFETVEPLKGEASAKLIHDDTINQSFKQSFPVDRKFRGRGLTLKLNIKSNASEGNVSISVVDETNAITIVNSEQLPASDQVGGTFAIVSFPVPENCASLSYEIVALPEAGSPETLVDDIIIELATTSLLSTSVEIPIITEWQSYTPTFQGLGIVTDVDMKWRQIGGTIEIQGKFTTGTIEAVQARVSFPETFLVESPNSVFSIGRAIRFAGGSAYEKDLGLLTQGGFNYFGFGATGDTGTGNPAVLQNGDAIMGSTNGVTINAKFKAAGLTATKATTIPLAQSILVNESDSVLYAAGNAGQSIATNVTDIPFNLVSNKGDDIIWNGNSFGVTKDGIYDITTTLRFTSGLAREARLYEDGVSIHLMGHAVSGIIPGILSTQLTTGKIYSIRVTTNGGTLSNTVDHSITITKQNSIKQVNVNPNSKITIPTSELRMEGASTRGSVDTAIVRFNSVAKLRGDAFEVISTVENGTKIVMKKKGKLDIGVTLAVGSNVFPVIARNQVVLTTAQPSEQLAAGGSATASMNAQMKWSGDVNIGDILRVVASATPSNSSANNLNLSFQEQDIAVSVTNVLPQFSESDSSIRLDTANGYGSVGNKIRRFANVRDNIGTDIEYIDSVTDGASFVIKSDGIYNVSYSDTMDIGGRAGLSLNSDQLNLDINAISAEDRLAMDFAEDTTGGSASVSWQGFLQKGDIIRPHTNGVASVGLVQHFTISKVGKPNVTGVDITPFVNIPQPDVEYFAGVYAHNNSNIASITQQSTNASSVVSTPTFSSNTITINIKKRCLFQLGIGISCTNNHTGFDIKVNGVSRGDTLSTSTALDVTSGGGSLHEKLNAGDVVTITMISQSARANNPISYVATATSDQIITPPEVFSSDTNTLTYAPSSLYTLSTLEDAPVGTFITFTYAASTNTRTQTTTAPTQTTADMNLNGLRIFTRPYNAASTAAEPAAFAIQIGKGFKGKTLDLYKNTGKEVSGEIDSQIQSSETLFFGMDYKSYNEKTGILVLDAGVTANTVVTRTFRFSDVTTQTNGYLVINASKSPLKLGFGIASDTSAKLGLDPDKFITPKTLRSGLNASGEAPVYACRAWVNFNGTGTVAIRESGNVSSITDNGTGDYTVNFTTAMPDVNYSYCGTASRSGTSGSIGAGCTITPNDIVTARTISSCRFVVLYNAGDGAFDGVIDSSNININVFR